MRRINRYFLCSVLLLVCFIPFIPPVQATETRVGSMGGVGFYMRDNSNIFFFPGTFYQYSNQVVGELRVKNDNSYYSIGMHLPVSNFVLGAYLNSPLDLAIPDGVVDQVSLDRITNLFFGTRLSSGFDLGINVRIGMDSYTEDITLPDTMEYSESARYLAIAAGLTNEKMDLGLMVELPAASSDPAAGILDEDSEASFSGLGVGFNGRFWLEKKDKFQLVPLLVAYYGSASTEIKPGGGLDTTYTTDYGRMSFAGGIGMNYSLNEDNLLVVGLEALGYLKESEEVKNEYENSVTTMTLPGIYIGLESKISKWLIGRFGAAQVFQSQTSSEKPEGGSEMETKTYSTEFKMTFGVGIMMGNFLLDASINEGLLFDGPNFISGSTEPMANRLSLTYNF
jgi:hypothetical protein